MFLWGCFWALEPNLIECSTIVPNEAGGVDNPKGERIHKGLRSAVVVVKQSSSKS